MFLIRESNDFLHLRRLIVKYPATIRHYEGAYMNLDISYSTEDKGDIPLKEPR